jgi:hypothetical protein
VRKLKVCLLIVGILFLYSCGGDKNELPKDKPTGKVDNSVKKTVTCTDFVPELMPNPEAFETVVEPFEVQGPTGNTIYGMTRRPDPAKYPDLCFPAVVLVPGGINPGRLLAYGRDAEVLAGSGMIVATFNAEGRVDDSPEDLRSEGAEDFNGFRQQEGLCAVVKCVMEMPGVYAENVGISSQSYGITMAAGCAGRHPEIGIKYIVDGEGPPNSFVTCHGARFLGGDMAKYETVKKIFDRLATWQDGSQENREWWAEREAIQFIGDFKGYYVRLQAEWDHAQPPENPSQLTDYNHPNGWPGGGPAWWHNKHTADIVNAAVAGCVPWVRVNLPQQGNLVNAAYGEEDMPVFLPGELADKPWAVWAILEMAQMDALNRD